MRGISLPEAPGVAPDVTELQGLEFESRPPQDGSIPKYPHSFSLLVCVMRLVVKMFHRVVFKKHLKKIISNYSRYQVTLGIVYPTADRC